MSHLVRALPKAGDGPLTIIECWRLVQEAHDYLACRGALAIEQARAAEGCRYWGSSVKRIRVALPDADRPALIAPSMYDHNLVEVLNQCAHHGTPP